MAEKKFTEVFQLIQKFEDRDLLEYVALKIETAQQIPSYQKELKSLINSLLKSLSKSPSFLPYDDTLNDARRAFELYDRLENDDKMNQITELQLILEHSANIAHQLKKMDEELKNLLENITPEV
jgi:hypothetical protein